MAEISLTPIEVFLLVGGIWILILAFVFFRARKSSGDKELEDDLCKLFYEQHLFLAVHKHQLYEYEKVKELLFFAKDKLFQEAISQDDKEKYLLLWQNDLKYVQELITVR